MTNTDSNKKADKGEFVSNRLEQMDRERGNNSRTKLWYICDITTLGERRDRKDSYNDEVVIKKQIQSLHHSTRDQNNEGGWMSR